MRVNVYAEEMTNRVEIISKEAEGRIFTGLRIYLELPVSYRMKDGEPETANAENTVIPKSQFRQLKGPFIHTFGDDDSSAVTFWGKQDLRPVLLDAVKKLDEYYAANPDRLRGS